MYKCIKTFRIGWFGKKYQTGTEITSDEFNSLAEKYQMYFYMTKYPQRQRPSVLKREAGMIPGLTGNSSTVTEDKPATGSYASPDDSLSSFTAMAALSSSYDSSPSGYDSTPSYDSGSSTDTTSNDFGGGDGGGGGASGEW